MGEMKNLKYIKEHLRLVSELSDDELWKAIGLEDEIEPLLQAIRKSWEAKLPELLTPRTPPDMTPLKDTKPFLP
jgi:hypothetical protein